MYKIISCVLHDLGKDLGGFFRPDSKTTLSEQYLFSNEFITRDLYVQLERASRAGSSGKLKAAILVGESHILSILPVLAKQCQIIMINDFDTDVLENVQKLVKILQGSSSRDEFVKQFLNQSIGYPRRYSLGVISDRTFSLKSEQKIDRYHNHPNKERVAKECLLEKSRILMGSFHFLFSEERFQECKKASKKTHFFYLSVNLLEKAETQSLASVLKRHEVGVSVLNITNIGDYDEWGISGDSRSKLAENISQLPLDSKAMILTSTVKMSEKFNYDNGKPVEEGWFFSSPMLLKQGVKELIDSE